MYSEPGLAFGLQSVKTLDSREAKFNWVFDKGVKAKL